jgi:molybdenum cofactor biosynthesis enzyme MoaA
MHRRQGIMSVELFRKIVDECAELGITHVRMHNYGEAIMDRKLVQKVRYAKQKGIKEVGMISNGSLITEPIARGMIDAGLDAINISVDASGKEVSKRPGSGSVTTRSSRISSGSSGCAPTAAGAVRS